MHGPDQQIGIGNHDRYVSDNNYVDLNFSRNFPYLLSCAQNLKQFDFSSSKFEDGLFAPEI